MNTEAQVRERAASLSERQLFYWIGIFSYMRGAEGELAAVPGGTAPPDPFANLSPSTIVSVLRQELATRRS